MKTVTPDQVAESVVGGPDTDRFRAEIQTYIDAGPTRIYRHQIGPDQAGFVPPAERELLPRR